LNKEGSYMLSLNPCCTNAVLSLQTMHKDCLVVLDVLEVDFKLNSILQKQTYKMRFAPI